ncbi:unnamed protein product [Trichobilharzia regenti]|nr:unnamed protein product [Trichobilharzia regenti]
MNKQHSDDDDNDEFLLHTGALLIPGKTHISDWNSSSQTLLYNASSYDVSIPKYPMWVSSEAQSYNGTYNRKESYPSSPSKQSHAIRSKMGSYSNYLSVYKMPNRYRSTGELNRGSSTPDSSICTVSSDIGQGSVSGNYYSRRFRPQSGYRSNAVIYTNINNQRYPHLYDMLAADLERTPSQISFSTSSSSDNNSHIHRSRSSDIRDILRSESTSYNDEYHLCQTARSQLQTNATSENNIAITITSDSSGNAPLNPLVDNDNSQVTVTSTTINNNNNSNNDSSLQGIKKRPNRIGKIDYASLERFMNDASSTLSSPLYDPYGMSSKIASWSSSHHPYSRRQIIDKRCTSPSSTKSARSMPPIPVFSESFLKKRKLRNQYKSANKMKSINNNV